jgi:hypothetical protein
MPYVTYNDIEELIPAGLKGILSDAGTFAIYEAQAATIISGILGNDVPADADDAEDFTTTPAAWIITKLCAFAKLSNAGDQLWDSINANYKLALDMLKARPTTVVTSAYSFAGVGEFSNNIKTGG